MSFFIQVKSISNYDDDFTIKSVEKSFFNFDQKWM